MLNGLKHLAIAAAASLATTTALAQSGSSPKATGPSGGQVWGDFMSWFEAHMGAALAVIALIVITLGYLAYGYMKPKDDGGK